MVSLGKWKGSIKNNAIGVSYLKNIESRVMLAFHFIMFSWSTGQIVFISRRYYFIYNARHKQTLYGSRTRCGHGHSHVNNTDSSFFGIPSIVIGRSVRPYARADWFSRSKYGIIQRVPSERSTIGSGVCLFVENQSAIARPTIVWALLLCKHPHAARVSYSIRNARRHK